MVLFCIFFVCASYVSFYNTRLFYIFLYLHVHRVVICLEEEVEEVEAVEAVDLGEAAVAATKEYIQLMPSF